MTELENGTNTGTTINDYLALELGRKELANVVLRAQLDAANARVAELTAQIVAEESAAVT